MFCFHFLDLLQLKVDPSPHCVHNRFGLLEDLLLHEGGEVALHDLLDLHLEGGDLPRQVALPVVSVDGEDSQLHGRHIVVLQEDHLERSVERQFPKHPESRTAQMLTLLVCSMMAEASLAKKYSTASPSEGWISSVWGSASVVSIMRKGDKYYKCSHGQNPLETWHWSSSLE